MKTLISSFSLLFIGTFGFSQNDIKVSEETQSFSHGSHNSIVVNIPFADKDLVLKELKSEMKSWGGKVDGKSDLVLKQGKMKETGDKPFDAYGKIVGEGSGGIKVAVAIDLGGAYLSSREHNDKYSVFVKKMKAFASRTAAQAMNDKIATEKKIFAALEKDQKNLIKEKEKKEKDIVDAKKEIEDSEKKLVENKSNTEAKSKELAVQKEKMAGLEELLRSIK